MRREACERRPLRTAIEVAAGLVCCLVAAHTLVWATAGAAYLTSTDVPLSRAWTATWRTADDSLVWPRRAWPFFSFIVVGVTVAGARGFAYAKCWTASAWFGLAAILVAGALYITAFAAHVARRLDDGRATFRPLADGGGMWFDDNSPGRFCGSHGPAFEDFAEGFARIGELALVGPLALAGLVVGAAADSGRTQVLFLAVLGYAACAAVHHSQLFRTRSANRFEATAALAQAAATTFVAAASFSRRDDRALFVLASTAELACLCFVVFLPAATTAVFCRERFSARVAVAPPGDNEPTRYTLVQALRAAPPTCIRRFVALFGAIAYQELDHVFVWAFFCWSPPTMADDTDLSSSSPPTKPHNAPTRDLELPRFRDQPEQLSPPSATCYPCPQRPSQTSDGDSEVCSFVAVLQGDGRLDTSIVTAENPADAAASYIPGEPSQLDIDHALESFTCGVRFVVCDEDQHSI